MEDRSRRMVASLTPTFRESSPTDRLSTPASMSNICCSRSVVLARRLRVLMDDREGGEDEQGEKGGTGRKNDQTKANAWSFAHQTDRI